MDIWKYLFDRFDREYLAVRVSRQMHHVSVTFSRSGTSTRFHPEEMDILHRMMMGFLKISTLHDMGINNALDHLIHTNTIKVKGLPARFEGFRILHLSDLHLDAYKGLGSHISSLIGPEAYDMAIITGDFCFRTMGPYKEAIDELTDMVSGLKAPCGVYSVLGNHDFIEMIPFLEEMGVRVLVNEAVNIGDIHEPFWIAGTDDPHFYGTHDLQKALHNVGEGQPIVLMTHSPEIVDEAYDAGCSVYLCGHTHGGQLCLPGGYAILTNTKCSRRYLKGAWTHGSMQGYTSSVTGSSGVFARFFCRPEIVIHVLNRA